jgi:NAD(P)-dependent dehydrogenase (short-subunit alcohol dehydrogenase family)
LPKSKALRSSLLRDEQFSSVRPTSLLKRFETPQAVATVVAFVASTRAVTINGAAVRAAGGVLRSIF